MNTSNRAHTWQVGLTGGIGSGKSTVAGLLEARGADIIDADAISRSTTGPGGLAMPAILSRFGSDFVANDGSLNREKMRARVFEQRLDKQALESIVHPLVAEEIQRRIHTSVASCLVFDIPLLVESSHWRKRLDHILVVDCSTSTQIRRVQRRNNWHREQVEAVIASQSPRLHRLAAADTVLLNDVEDMKVLEALVAGWASQFGLL